VVEIQAQDTSGNWRTYHVTINDSQRILSEMKSLQSLYPHYRIRAIDMETKRVVDIL